MLINALTIPRGDLRYLRINQDVACLSSDAVGDLVCIRDIPVNGKWRVEKANPGDASKMPSIGILTKKITPTVGVVQLYGPVFNIFSGLTIKKTYCVDYDGIRIGPPGIGPSGYSFRQFIGVSIATDILFLEIDLSMIKRR